MDDTPPFPGTPLWAKVFGIIAILVVLVFAILMFTRGARQGPARHLPSGDAGGQTSFSIVTVNYTLTRSGY